MAYCFSKHAGTFALVFLVLSSASAFASEPGSSVPEKGQGPLDKTRIAETLKGKVQFNVLHVQEAVSEMKDQVKKLRKYSMILATEANRQATSMARGPNVIGSTVIPAAPNPTGSMALGPPLPVRPGFVSALIKDMSKEITNLHDRNNAILGAVKREDNWQEEWLFVTSITRDMITHYNKLVTMLRNRELNNKDVGREALRIYEDTSAIQAPLEKVTTRLNKLSAENSSGAPSKE